jgi:hypothetical protein
MKHPRVNLNPESAESASQQSSNSHFGRFAEFGVHPLGCPPSENTLKRGHQTPLACQNENCCQPGVSTFKWFWHGARFLAPALALCLWAGCGKPAPKAANTGKAAANAPVKTAATNAVTMATNTNPFLSAFLVPTNSPKDGRDPFFPVSIRTVEATKPRSKSKEGQKTVETAPEGILDVFITPTRPPTAIINHHTFFKGDVANITLGNARVPVTCLDISGGLAAVLIDGHRRELYSGKQFASVQGKNLELLASLKLEHISPPPNRLAMINGRTFSVGETGPIRLPDGTNSISLKCEEIRNDSVVVVIDGERHILPPPAETPR